MPRRDPQRARVLGLWTAGWLAAFLVAGMLWLGEPSVQWPVLAVPLLWALVALRPRRRGAVDDEPDTRTTTGGTTTGGTTTGPSSRPGTRLPAPARRSAPTPWSARHCAVPPSSTSGDAAGPAEPAAPLRRVGWAWRM